MNATSHVPDEPLEDLVKNSVTTSNENSHQAAPEEKLRPALMDEGTAHEMALEMRSLAEALFRLLLPQRAGAPAQSDPAAPGAPSPGATPVTVPSGVPLPESTFEPPSDISVPAAGSSTAPQAPPPVPVPAYLPVDDAVPVTPQPLSHASGSASPPLAASIPVPPVAVSSVSGPAVKQDAENIALTEGDAAAPPTTPSVEGEQPTATTKRRSMAVLNEIAFLDD
jgi:hypothetical protein